MEQNISNLHRATRFPCFVQFYEKGYRSSHNEVAASAWQQRNADWWSEMTKANTNIHHHENSPTNSCGPMDTETDNEAAGRLRSTSLHCIIVAVLDGRDKKLLHYHVLRN
jgi:hypothetical protein